MKIPRGCWPAMIREQYGSAMSRLFQVALICAAVSVCASAQKVSFGQALDLALKRSAGMGMAVADQVRARQGYLETRNAYVPQVTFGSGVAKTWGYPMSIEGSAPSIFNINSQSYLINFAQRDFMRAARTDWNAASLSLQDQREVTLLEAALVYIQLDRTSAKLQALQRESTEAGRLQTISRERQREGIDSRLDVTRASLNAARARVRLAETQGNVDLLRQRLAQLTGLDARELETDPTSIPAPPEINQQDDMAARAVAASPAVKAADERARAAALRARGEHKQLYPAVDLVGNYGLFTKYNNLDLLFPTGQFSRNNATFGASIRFSFLNAPQRAKAAAADAEALRAEKQAQAAREQVSNDTLKLQRTVQQLSAAADVAQLEYELAAGDVEAIQVKLQAGSATIKDQESARIEASDKQAALFDIAFELDRVRLQLLRATGDLEKWALP
jgi:outer membrane protein TolC